jgi:hypothetical protein
MQLKIFLNSNESLMMTSIRVYKRKMLFEETNNLFNEQVVNRRWVGYPLCLTIPPPKHSGLLG